LPADDDGFTAFSYSEKGTEIDGRPTIVFVHGLSSNKESWLSIIKVSAGKLFVLFNKKI
jgi:pimeloyl-ACP methyl ester carboxylesterase